MEHICRAATIPGPVGTTTYIIDSMTMREAKAAVAAVMGWDSFRYRMPRELMMLPYFPGDLDPVELAPLPHIP